jgi:hypothetical protein
VISFTLPAPLNTGKALGIYWIEAGWFPKLVFMLWNIEIFLARSRNRNPAFLPATRRYTSLANKPITKFVFINVQV